MLSTIAFGAKRVTLQELTTTINSLQLAGKSDEDFLASLQQVQLSEELTAAAAASLREHLPGPLSQEGLVVLQALSMFEPASSSGVPDPPAAPDAAAQGAILKRAESWIGSAVNQAPNFKASKVVQRFQQVTQSTTPPFDKSSDTPNNFGRISEEHKDAVEVVAGAEKLIDPGPPVKWGANGLMSEGSPMLALPALFQEAAESGKLAFARWEAVNGKPAAVFTFSIEKKKSHYTVDYCCFTIAENFHATSTPTGDLNLQAPATFPQSSWKPFKKLVSYHGSIYIDAESGAVLRTVTVAELKPYDWVHAEEVLTDYAIETLSGKQCAVPVRKITLNETVPGADTRQFSYPVRRELFTADYANYAVR